MWGLRRQVSLLMDHGHPCARLYPISMVWEEAEIVVQRVNQESANNTALFQLAGAAVQHAEGRRKLIQVLKELTSGQG